MQSIEVKFLPATNYQPTRLKATAGNNISVIKGRNYQTEFKDQALELALELANNKLNWNVRKFAVGCFKEKYYFVITEFNR
jgi:hypothetical protein